MPNVSRRFRVVGKVQGVYFRHSTRIEAERLNLAGFARNASDGSVEVMAHGPADAVAQLQEWLKSGPPSARVDQLSELELDLATHAGEDAAPRSLTFEVL